MFLIFEEFSFCIRKKHVDDFDSDILIAFDIVIFENNSSLMEDPEGKRRGDA